MNRRITIKDIAKVSGCSVNCVSRALMDAPDISQKTKDKIKQVALEMGYVHNRDAASLRTLKSHTIAILYDSLLNPYYQIMTNYLWERLHESGYSILTFKSDAAIFDEEMARQIVSTNVDGLLSFLQPSQAAQALLNVNVIPVVVVGRKTHGLCDCVYIDDIKGGRLAAQHFISRGYVKPLYMGITKQLDCSVERGKGFVEEFASAKVTAETVFLDDLDGRDFATHVRQLHQSDNLPDCIFCFNDQAAYQVMAELNKLNASHVAVIGFDNIQQEIAMPSLLTTISFNKKELTDTAVTILLNEINGIEDNHSAQTVISDLTVVRHGAE